MLDLTGYVWRLLDVVELLPHLAAVAAAPRHAPSHHLALPREGAEGARGAGDLHDVKKLLLPQTS